jgi:ATP-dependent exoDNAse (exonuclease V) alpha subunit
VVNAHRVNEGRLPESLAKKDEGDEETPADAQAVGTLPMGSLNTTTDFHFIPVTCPEDALKRVVDLCAREIPSKFRFNPLVDIQVLAPMHRGVCGVANLNRELQRALNPATSFPEAVVAMGMLGRSNVLVGFTVWVIGSCR